MVEEGSKNLSLASYIFSFGERSLNRMWKKHLMTL